MKHKTFKVWMFGGVHIEYGGKRVQLPVDIHSVTAQLLLILWCAGDKGANRELLLNWLYGESEISDPANSMRVNIYRLRKMIKRLPLPGYEYIVVDRGLYRWDSGAVPLETDVNMFINDIQSANAITEGAEKYALLENACNLYKGDFIPALAAEQWAAIKTVEYQKMYSEAVMELFHHYMEIQEYDQAVFLADRALKIYPYEAFATMKIDAFIAQGNFNKALDTLDEISRILFADFGVMPSAEILKRYESISSRVSNSYSAIKDIKEQFGENKAAGAYYCSFPSFVDCYRVLNRLSTRNGQSLFLVNCSMSDNQGNRLERGTKVVENASFLMEAIERSLRMGDVYTRSNDNQFLILLSNLTQEDCNAVTDRISQNFLKTEKVRGIKVDFIITLAEN